MCHPQDSLDLHYCGVDCGCGTKTIVDNMAVYVVHSPPPEKEYEKAIQDFLSRCLN
jgi:hypothetical protein